MKYLLVVLLLIGYPQKKESVKDVQIVKGHPKEYYIPIKPRPSPKPKIMPRSK